jgi:hypothetical protein
MLCAIAKRRNEMSGAPDSAIAYTDGGPDTSVPAPAHLTGNGGASPPANSALSGGYPDTSGLFSDLKEAAQKKYGMDSYLYNTYSDQLDRDRGRMQQAFNKESADAADAALTHPWNADQQRADRIRGPLEQFGSVGMVFALAASAFSKTPMVSALNAGAAAMNAMRQSDELGYKSAYEAWKANTDLAVKRFDIERAVYEDANKLATTDVAAWKTKMAAAAAQFDNQKILAMLDHGMDAEVFKAIEAQTQARDQVVKYQQDMQDLDLTSKIGKTNFEKWKEEHPPPGEGASQQEKLKYGLEMRMAENQALVAAKKQVYDAKHTTYGAGGLTTSKDQATRIVERTQQLVANGEETDPVKAHDRAAHEVQEADSKAHAAGTQAVKDEKGAKPTMSPEGIDLAANMLIKGNPAATTNVGRNAQGAANLIAIKERAAEILKERGLNPEQAAQVINDNTAAFQGDKSGARIMANRVAQIEQAGHIALNTADRVIETSKAVPRTKYSDINAIMINAKNRTGDEAVINYGIALTTLINNYARTFGGGNAALTEGARKEAHDLLQKEWSQGQIETAIKQMKKEIASELKGAEEAREGWGKLGVTADSKPLKVKTPAEAQDLAPGTKYETPDGRVFTR